MSAHTSQVVADIVRWIVLAEGALLAGFSVAVMVEARKFRMPPAHVWAISTSYVLLVIGYGVEVANKLGEGWGGRTPLAAVSFTFGVYSMWLMWRAYKYASRMRRHEQRAIEEGNRLMGEAFKRKSDHPGERSS